jgi:anti-sigma B factor antagonist
MSADEQSFELLRIASEHYGSEAIIVLEGEFDLAGTERFWAFADAALAAEPRAVIVDVSGLEFVDSSGLLALMRVRDAAVEIGAAFTIRNPSVALRRIVELAGLEELLAQ